MMQFSNLTTKWRKNGLGVDIYRPQYGQEVDRGRPESASKILQAPSLAHPLLSPL